MGRPMKRTDAIRSDLANSTSRIGRGRPTKRTQAVMEAIAEAIRTGATFTLAAYAGRINYDTFNEWRKAYPDFSEMVDAAVAESALFHLANIKQHAVDDWRASGWMLEHRFPHEYGRTVQEHTGEQGLNITISKRTSPASSNESE